MESTSYVISFRMVFFYLVTTGWSFDISLRENSINSIKIIINVTPSDSLSWHLCMATNNVVVQYHECLSLTASIFPLGNLQRIIMYMRL